MYIYTCVSMMLTSIRKFDMQRQNTNVYMHKCTYLHWSIECKWSVCVCMAKSKAQIVNTLMMSIH